MTSTPQSTIDSIVDHCVSRCLESESPLTALTLVLEAVAVTTKFTELEFQEIKRRTIHRIAEAEISDDECA